jgi:hypothetical protein
MRTTIAILLILLFTHGTAAGQEVTVIQPVTEGTDVMAAKTKALEQGFAEAAVLASIEILPGQLSGDRQKLLQEYLASRVRELVLSYTELEYQQTWTELTLKLDVLINRQILKKHLRESGVFYTSVEPWPYSLTLSGGPPGGFLVVDDLQRLTGLVIRPDVDPALILSLAEGGGWRGELSTGERVITGVHQDLGSLWFKLWGQYFNLPEVQARVMRTAVLFTEGWANVRQAAAFDKELNGWDRLVEEARLTEIDMGARTITGRWVLKVRNSDLLMQNLKGRLTERGISYSFLPPADGEPIQSRP